MVNIYGLNKKRKNKMAHKVSQKRREVYDEHLKQLLDAHNFCPICKKRITQKMWDSQESLSLRLEHSLGGGIGQWGDEIIDCLFCSRKCFNKIFKFKDLKEMDWKINEFLFIKRRFIE